MKINGIGNVKRSDVMEIMTSEGKEAFKAGLITEEEAGAMYKLQKVKELSKIGKYPDTFNTNFHRLPDGLFEKLTPEELAALVDVLYTCYLDGKSN